MRANDETIRRRLDGLIAEFDTHAAAFDSAVVVEDDRQFGSHRRTIGRRRELGSIGAAIDVTAQRRTEAAVRASEAQFRSFADHSTNLIWIGDPTGAKLEISAPPTTFA